MTTLRRLFVILRRLLVGIIALAVVAYAVLFVINLNDAAPSDLTLEILSSYESRPALDDSENAYLMMLGFSALRDDDPLLKGIERRDWLLTAGPRFDSAEDPLLLDLNLRSSRSEAINELAELCQGRDPGLECAAALGSRQDVVREWRESEAWLLLRYERLLTLRAFREHVPLDLAAPLPAYHALFAGQKRLFLEAFGAARSGDAKTVRRLLEADLSFWRSVVRQSDFLITKMIATGGAAKNFKFGNLVLRELPVDAVSSAIPDTWRTPLRPAERSMLRCFKGEWLFSENVVRANAETGYNSLNGALYGHEETLWEKVRWTIVKPFWQPQDSSNRHAELLVEMAGLLDGELADLPYSIAQAKALADSRFWPPSRPYNFIGDFLFAGSGTTLPDYAARVSDLEGIRRATLLLANLRSEGASINDIPDAIRASDIVSPYTGAPFEWNAAEKALVFRGLEPSARSTHRLVF